MFACFRVPDVYTQFRKLVENQARVRPCLDMPEKFKPLPADIDEGVIPTCESLGQPGLSPMFLSLTWFVRIELAFYQNTFCAGLLSLILQAYQI